MLLDGVVDTGTALSISATRLVTAHEQTNKTINKTTQKNSDNNKTTTTTTASTSFTATRISNTLGVTDKDCSQVLTLIAATAHPG